VEKRRATVANDIDNSSRYDEKILALSSVGCLAKIDIKPLLNAAADILEVDTFMFFSDSCHVLYLLSRNSQEQQKV
jgi:hypothetical protein